MNIARAVSAWGLTGGSRKARASPRPRARAGGQMHKGRSVSGCLQGRVVASEKASCAGGQCQGGC